MKKGYSTEGWLNTLIKIVLLVLVIFVTWTTLKEFYEHITEGISVQSSVNELATAINKVNRCIDDERDDCTYGIDVTVSVPQNLDVLEEGTIGDPSVGHDPLWVIYHNYCMSNDDNDDNVGCKNENTYLVREADCECHSLWDSGKFAPRCENDVCWGLIENVNPGTAQIDETALERLEPFYIIDPCYAVVKVREDPNNLGHIQICFDKLADAPSIYNWCYSEDTECTLSNSRWPESPDVWSEKYPSVYCSP